MLRLCATSRKVAGSIPDGVIVINFPEVYSVSNRNEYQEYFLGETGSLNLLETLWPVQTCIGIALF